MISTYLFIGFLWACISLWKVIDFHNRWKAVGGSVPSKSDLFLSWTKQFILYWACWPWFVWVRLA